MIRKLKSGQYRLYSRKVNPATGNDQLQVTLRFNLVLITPIVAQVTANRIVMTAAALYRTEY